MAMGKGHLRGCRRYGERNSLIDWRDDRRAFDSDLKRQLLRRAENEEDRSMGAVLDVEVLLYEGHHLGPDEPRRK